jgi:LysR family hydrogen peroxide-inducible transcriptional activator
VCGTSGANEVGDVRATSLCTLVQMVASGEGVTLLPEIASAVEVHGDAIRVVPFGRPTPSRTIGLAWRPGSASGEDFEAFGDAIAAVHRSARAR